MPSSVLSLSTRWSRLRSPLPPSTSSRMCSMCAIRGELRTSTMVGGGCHAGVHSRPCSEASRVAAQRVTAWLARSLTIRGSASRAGRGSATCPGVPHAAAPSSASTSTVARAPTESSAAPSSCRAVQLRLSWRSCRPSRPTRSSASLPAACSSTSRSARLTRSADEVRAPPAVSMATSRSRLTLRLPSARAELRAALSAGTGLSSCSAASESSPEMLSSPTAISSWPRPETL